jgi:hypothetical protein
MELNQEDFVFQTDSDIIKDAFEKDNYLVVYNEQCTDKRVCAIYFSSNDIYFPNSEDVFRKRIIEKDFYELYNTRINYAYKHIFVRDIKKQWYVSGINSRIHSPQLLLAFLKGETEGYSVITVGSSAGGYAAVLYGSLLPAILVFSFNGQFEVNSLLKSSNAKIDPLLFRCEGSALSNYFDLKDFINTKIDIYYFVSSASEWDYQQYKHISTIPTVKVIFFNTAHHGIPFVKSALTYVINLDSATLDKFVGKKFNSIEFSIRIVGVVKTCVSICRQLVHKIKRRL